MWNKMRLDDMRNNSRRDFEGSNENDIEEDIKDFQNEWLNDPLTKENTTLQDPEFLVGETFNATMMEMKEHLLAAI